MGAGVPYLTGSQLPKGKTSQQLLIDVFDRAVEAGFTIVRAWAHGVDVRYPSRLEEEDGTVTINDGLLQGLDFALYEASKRGLKMILSYTSNWTPVGGVDEYAGSKDNHNNFFLQAAPKEAYKSYVRSILNRINVYNGVLYKDDSTIMAHNLINEPVCRNCPQGTITAWVKEMAAFVKSIDPNHLLTVGEEGFWSTTSSYIENNPRNDGSNWAAEYTQDFHADHSDPNIDFMSFHAWPDLWSGRDLDWFKNVWISAHVKAATEVGKPLMLEEFGKEFNGRDGFYQAAYDAVVSSLQQGGPLKGALFWQWYVDGQAPSVGETSIWDASRGRFGVLTSDSAFALAEQNAADVAGLSNAVGECSEKGPQVSIPMSCPPGFEGVECDVDVNQCTRGSANCHPTAMCINNSNNSSGFECLCPLGSIGDPIDGGGGGGCKEDTASIAGAMSLFWNDPVGQACDTGADVIFPINGAGWIEDQTGYFDRNEAFKGGFGARGEVSEGQCAVACAEADRCQSWTYNSVTKGCFLKRGQCPTNNNCQEEIKCETVSDTGVVINVSCGSWTTYYLKELKEEADASGRCVVAFEG